MGVRTALAGREEDWASVEAGFARWRRGLRSDLPAGEETDCWARLALRRFMETRSAGGEAQGVATSEVWRTNWLAWSG